MSGRAPTRRFRLGLRLRLALICAGVAALACDIVLIVAVFLVDDSIVSSVQFPAGAQVQVTLPDGQSGLADAQDVLRAVRDSARTSLLVRGLILSAFVILFAGAAGYAVAARALGPIAEVTAAARRISAEGISRGTVGERIALTGSRDELKDLADTFDGMLDRLDQVFEVQRRFVANASHELRTPLAVMRTEVDVTLADPDASVAELRRMGEVIQGATDRANQLVDALLVLARSQVQAEQGLDVHEPVDLGDVLPTVVSAVAAEASRNGVSVDVHPHPAPVVGDPQLLERMVGNLVENSIRHNVMGGWVQIHSGAEAGRVMVSVANSGELLDPLMVEELFAPFRRAVSRTQGGGAGLGLSIVRAVADAHGGSVRALARPEGGLEVVVDLPARDREPATAGGPGG